MAPEGGIHHRSTLQDLLPRKSNEFIVKIAVVSRIKAHSIGPCHHVIFDQLDDIRMPHTVADSQPCHAKYFRKSSRDEHIGAFTHQIDHRRIVWFIGELVIGLIDQNRHTGADFATEST